ncbi:MAG: DUF192 domain-containing protein, partial [bacterium]
SHPSGISVPRVTVAAGFWRRFMGRLWTSDFPMGEGLLLLPCHEIHMLGMKYPLDVVFLDRSLTVLAVHPNVRIGIPQLAHPGAWATLELPVGTVGDGWDLGMELCPGLEDSTTPLRGG